MSPTQDVASQGTNDFGAGLTDAGLDCLPAYAPLVAHRYASQCRSSMLTCKQGARSHRCNEHVGCSVNKWTCRAVACRTIAILEALRSTCPDARFILRGLGPRTSVAGVDTWPNMFTVVRLLKESAASSPV